MAGIPNDLAAFRARRHFAGLDGLRCAAIAMVVWHHCYFGSSMALQRGFLGVDMFCALSGFLITTLLLRERDATGDISLPRFWIRRALRLFPAFYVLMLPATAYYAWRGGPPAEGFFRTLPTDLLYLSNWFPSEGPNLGILWSLATEQQFYLVWPLVERAGRKVALTVLLLFMAVNQVVNFGLVDDMLGPLRGYAIVQATYMPLCLGVLLAHLLDSPRAHPPVARLLAHPATLPVSALLLAALLIWAPTGIEGAPRLGIQLLFTVLIGAVVMRPQATALLEFRPIARIGAVSYGIYLFHLPICVAVAILLRRAELESTLPLFILSLGLAWGVAELSFRLVEQPILRFSHRFRAPRRNHVAPLAAEAGD